MEEEEILLAELKKIELRKKEREKKQQDLQKLISAAEHNTEMYTRSVLSWLVVIFSFLRRKAQKKGSTKKSKIIGGMAGGGTLRTTSEATMVFKTYDKSSGVSLRSSKVKFPLTLGQKKTKTIEQVLEELTVG